MSPSKSIRYIVVAFLFCLILNGVTSQAKNKTYNPVAGVVELSKTDSYAQYKSTLINSYDPDVSWKFGEDFGTATQPEISGESGLLVDLTTGKVLVNKNIYERRKIASLTKIMTAVLALEHKKLDDKFYVSEKAANIGEDVMGISTGEVYPLEDLLYGLLLHSGNDAAYAISEGVAGSSDRFVDWMNFKAEELGLKDTHFTDPSGLDDDTYSTAADLVRLTNYALKNPEFRKIVKTFEYETNGDTHKYIYLQNETNLLSTYPGVEGVKTGYTEEAGLCLVTYAVQGGHELLGVDLKSMDRKGDMLLMLDHGFSTIGIAVSHPALTF